MGNSDQHHASFSNFSSGSLSSKQDSYSLLLESAKALFVDDDGVTKLPAISNLSNAAALLWGLYREIRPSVNWAGFYIRDPTQNTTKTNQTSKSSDRDSGKDSETERLILGPFQGKVACQIILFGKGVCGTAAAQRKTQVVANVHEFPGHIACDGGTLSEIVVPIVIKPKKKNSGGADKNGKENESDKDVVIGVIDIDSLELNSFDEIDQKYLEEFAEIIAEYTNWDHYL